MAEVPMNATHSHPHETDGTDAVNALLLGELAAVETYDRAMEKFEDQTVLADLQKIRQEHMQAAVVLRAQVVQTGGQPVRSCGPWGTFASAVTGTAKIIGPATALSALRQGEEHEINGYEDGLQNEDVPSDCKAAIRTELLPRCREHVDELNRLMGGMK